MALSVTSLETLLPAAVIAAVAGAASGLTTAATQVYVARTKRTQPTSVEAWIQPPSETDDVEGIDGGLGHTRQAYRYKLTIEAGTITAAALHGWRDAIRAYFDGFKRPNATGLYACFVEQAVTDMHPGENAAGAFRCVLRFEEV